MAGHTARDMADKKILQPGLETAAVTAEVDGNTLALIESGEQRLQALLDLIGGARKSLRLLFYMFADDEVGEKVRDALLEAIRRGVSVRLLVDGFGCADADPDFYKPLAEEGGDYCVFHASYGRRYLLRNHQKLAIADEQRVLIGGSNIQNAYLKDEGEKHWRDLWLSIDGPTAGGAVKYFDDVFAWTNGKHAKLRRLRWLIKRHTQHFGALQWKFTSPLGFRNPWPRALAHDLASANCVDIIAAYFSPPRSVLRRLARISPKGRVRVITAAKSDNHATIGAARHTYSRLLRRGVSLFEYQPARLHTKLVIVDDVVYIGSANFDFRSFYINLELMLRIEDRDFASAMRGYFERETQDCEQITAELHRERATAWRRFKWTVSHFLVTSMDYTVSRRLNFKPES